MCALSRRATTDNEEEEASTVLASKLQALVRVAVVVDATKSSL